MSRRAAALPPAPWVVGAPGGTSLWSLGRPLWRHSQLELEGLEPVPWVSCPLCVLPVCPGSQAASSSCRAVPVPPCRLGRWRGEVSRAHFHFLPSAGWPTPGSVRSGEF